MKEAQMFHSRQEQESFLFSAACKSAHVAPSISMGIRRSLRPRPASDNHFFISEATNDWRYTATPTFIMTWCSIKQGQISLNLIYTVLQIWQLFHALVLIFTTVLSLTGLCDETITRPEESYRLWCVVVCDLETSWRRRPWPIGGLLCCLLLETSETIYCF
jgi:hypothetical protein